MIIGIDLGTTNSLIAVWEEGGPKLIPNAQGNFLTPSVVSLDFQAISLSESRQLSSWMRIINFLSRALSVTWEPVKFFIWAL